MVDSSGWWMVRWLVGARLVRSWSKRTRSNQGLKGKHSRWTRRIIEVALVPIAPGLERLDKCTAHGSVGGGMRLGCRCCVFLPARENEHRPVTSRYGISG